MNCDDTTSDDASAVELVRRIAARQTTATEIVREYLSRIALRDPELNAFSVVLADQATKDAAGLDAAIAAGDPPGPLHGVPIAVKDGLDVAGCVTTHGGRPQLRLTAWWFAVCVRRARL